MQIRLVGYHLIELIEFNFKSLKNVETELIMNFN